MAKGLAGWPPAVPGCAADAWVTCPALLRTRAAPAPPRVRALTHMCRDGGANQSAAFALLHHVATDYPRLFLRAAHVAAHGRVHERPHRRLRHGAGEHCRRISPRRVQGPFLLRSEER